MPYINAPLPVEPPPVPPRPYGLFDVALGPLPFPDPNFGAGGVIYVPDDCDNNVFVIATNCPPITGTKTFVGVEAAVSGAPFVVMTSYTCGAIGFSFDEAVRRVTQRLEVREQRAVERRVWQGSSGVLGTVPGLFRGATNLGSAGCVTEALEMLEQTLSDNGVRGGMIHARTGLAAHLQNNFLIYEGPGKLKRTVLNTPYVFGHGYDGTGPTGQAVDGTQEWMYASGQIRIWQDSNIFVPPPEMVLDRSLNQMNLIAERQYVVTVECGVWAVNVTRTCTTAGGGT